MCRKARIPQCRTLSALKQRLGLGSRGPWMIYLFEEELSTDSLRGVTILREAGTSCWILQKEGKQFYDAKWMDIKLQMWFSPKCGNKASLNHIRQIAKQMRQIKKKKKKIHKYPWKPGLSKVRWKEADDAARCSGTCFMRLQEARRSLSASRVLFP